MIKLNKKRNETHLKISGSVVELNSFFFFRNLLSRALEFSGQLGHICSFGQLLFFFFALKPGIVPPQYRRTVTITIKITKRTNQYLQKIISLQLT